MKNKRHIVTDDENDPHIGDNGNSNLNNNAPVITKIEDDGNNHIYFYSDITVDRAMDLTKKLRRVDQDLRIESIRWGLGDDLQIPIWLHIQSFGGEVFAGLGMSDVIGSLKSPTYAVIEGVCASAATLLALSCDKTYITPNSFILIHQIWSFWFGSYEEFKDEEKLQDMLMTKIVRFYTGHTFISEKKIRKMLKRDTWLNAEEALKMGFVDDILT